MSGGPPITTSGTSGVLYAYDQREVPKVGVRSPEWTAVGATEVDVLLEMARCLRELGAGRVPR